MSDEILTLTDVAALLKVAEKTIYTLAQQGELPGLKVGRQWRFRRQDLDRWIEARSTGHTNHSQPSSLRAAEKTAKSIELLEANRNGQANGSI